MAELPQSNWVGSNSTNTANEISQNLAELDKAASAIGEAELKAENELLKTKIKNLDELQKKKLEQLNALIELEESKIQELASLKLTLTEKQLKQLKKEIQIELDQAKKAVEGLFKTDNSPKTPKKQKTNIGATEGQMPVSMATSGSTKLKTEISSAIKPINDTLKAIQKSTLDISKRSTSTGSSTTNLTVATTNTAVGSNPGGKKGEAAPPVEPVQPATAAATSAQKQFSDASKNMSEADIGRYDIADVLSRYEANKDSIKAQNPNIEKDISKVTAKEGKKSSQTSIEFAVDLLDNFKSAEDAIKKLREFNEKAALNKRLVKLAEEQKLRASHEQAAYNNTIANIKAIAMLQDLKLHEDLYASEAASKLAIEHINKESDFRLAKINAEAREKDIEAKAAVYRAEARHALELGHIQTRAKLAEEQIHAEQKKADLRHNKRLYVAEEEATLKKALIEEQNKLTEAHYKLTTDLAFTKAHKDDLLELESQKLRNAHEEAAHKARLGLIATEAKAKDLVANKAAYIAEEEQRLQQQFADKENQLTEDEYKRKAQLDYLESKRKELIDQNLADLRGAQAAEEIKQIEAHNRALARAQQLEEDRAPLLAAEIKRLADSHTDKQNELNNGLIKADAKASDLKDNKPAYEKEQRLALEKALKEEQNKLIEDLYSTETSIAFTKAHEDEIRATEHQKLVNRHAAEYDKYLKDILAAEEKAKDLEHNRSVYLNEELDKLERGHKEEQNKLTQDLINAEAKGIDLRLNKDLYALEAKEAREKSFAETRNKLTEDLITAEENVTYDSVHKKELLDQEVFKLQVGHTDNLHKANLDLIAAEAKAKDLSVNLDKYRAEAKQALEIAHLQEQNRLTDEIIKAEEKEKDIAANKDQYRAEIKQSLELGHIQERNKLAEDILKAEEKRNDLLHNKKLYKQEEEATLNKALIDEQNKLTEDLYKIEVSIAYTKAHKDELLAIESQKLRNEHAAAYDKHQKDMLAETAKADDLAHNKRKYYNKELRDLELSYVKKQNKLAEEQIQAEAKLDFIRHNKGLLLSQAEHELRIGHINAEHDAMQALINAQAKKDDLTNNRAQYLKEAAQNLEVGHVTKQNDLTQASINAEAKGKDLADNRDQYEIEARMARENAFYDERNRQAEELIQLETELAWEKANSDDILAQELQKKRLGYLKEYQEYQKKAGKYAVDQKKFEKDQARKDNNAKKKAAIGGMTEGLQKFGTGEFSMVDLKKSYGEYMGARTAELKDAGMDDASAELTAQFELLAEAAGGLAAALDADVRKIADVQGVVDTRLQGSQVNDKKGQSYWKQLLKDAKSIAGASPFMRQEKLVENIKGMVEKGISFNVKQRAFLTTIQEKIANTFNAADGTLLRLIRIQQKDTTAGRLGMESALNTFLNQMYETSEYLSDVASNVRSSLEEMQALMEGQAATELEFQIQKWMGSLYSVGMSQNAVQDIAKTFGELASGDISGLTGGGTGNLLIMAANEAGKSIADILQNGMDAKETNELMQAMVNYLAEIAESSSDSRVVQQQLANVYGMKASDLRAASSLATSVKDVAKQDLTYNGMLGQLQKMMNTLNQRTSISEGMTNMWDNVMYSMASTQASNPILWALPKMANLLKDVTGGSGIALPFVNVMGFGVDLNTSVADLMMVASMAGTALGALGPLFSGIADLATGGGAMLSRAGIKTSGKAPVLARGSATPLQNLSGSSISESGLIGNSSGEDVKKATLQDAEDSKKKQMVEAKEEESADDVVIRSQQAIIDIYNLLEEVAHGSQSLRVRLVNTAGLGCNCTHVNEQGQILGNGNNGVTNGNSGAGVNGMDNGNWVLTF